MELSIHLIQAAGIIRQQTHGFLYHTEMKLIQDLGLIIQGQVEADVEFLEVRLLTLGGRKEGEEKKHGRQTNIFLLDLPVSAQV